MESERNTRLIALVALVAAVGGLALGFSSFTRDLYIKPTADVTLDKDLFKVEFSEAANAKASTKSVSPSTTGAEDGATGDSATINNGGDNPTISGLNAKFTKPGQKVTYEFYAVNTGSIDAYLTGITFSKTLTDNKNKECSAATTENKATNTDLIKAACDNVTLTVTVDGLQEAQLTATDDTKVQDAKYKLNKYSNSYDSHKITVDIEYKSENATIPDGDFIVKFDDVKLNYSAVDPTPQSP